MSGGIEEIFDLNTLKFGHEKNTVSRSTTVEQRDKFWTVLLSTIDKASVIGCNIDVFIIIYLKVVCFFESNF